MEKGKERKEKGTKGLGEGGGETHFSKLLVPFLAGDAYFDGFGHAAGGDDDADLRAREELAHYGLADYGFRHCGCECGVVLCACQEVLCMYVGVRACVRAASARSCADSCWAGSETASECVSWVAGKMDVGVGAIGDSYVCRCGRRVDARSAKSERQPWPGESAKLPSDWLRAPATGQIMVSGGSSMTTS